MLQLQAEIREKELEGRVLLLWKMKLDTSAIAKRLGIFESEAANALARIRDFQAEFR